MEKIKLKKNLLEWDSIFSWDMPLMPDLSYEDFIKKQIEKCENMEDETDFQWTRFVINLLVSYELCDKLKDYSAALTHSKWCEDHLLNLNKAKCTEPLFCSLYSLLLRIVGVTRAIIFLESGQLNKAYETDDEWRIRAPLLTKNLSGLLGLKSAVYLQYGTAGHRLALQTAQEAKNLDPNQAEWYFIIGNALGRIRRIKYGEITEEEIAAIEKAFALEKNATYTVHLAQLHSEIASNFFFKKDYVTSRKYGLSASSRYREALKMRPNCISLKARVAHGLLRIRDGDGAEAPEARRLLEEVIEATKNNSMAYHDLGYYYANWRKNFEEAIVCLDKSNKIGNIQALTYQTNLKWKHGRKNEIIGDLKEALTRYKSDEGQALLFACLGASHALVDNDWKSAVECFQNSLNVDPSANYLENFKLFGKKVNLLQLVITHLHVVQDQRFPNFVEMVKKMRPNIHHSVTSRLDSFRMWKEELSSGSKKNKKPSTGGRVQPLKPRN